MNIGIVGLPNIGKSTLFNALLKKQTALAANYPFATIEPNVGIVDVPDNRLNVLAHLVHEEYSAKYSHKDIPERIVPASIKFNDIAGLVKGAHKGEGLGNQFLAHIREVDAIVHVVRAFEDTNIIREGSIDPISDIEVINTELVLADFQAMEKRLDNFSKEIKRNKTTENLKRHELYEKVTQTLNRGNLLSSLLLNEEDSLYLKELNLLTAKPVIYVFNVSEDILLSGLSTLEEKYSEFIQNNSVLFLCAKIESELSALSPDERLEYLSDLGISNSGLDQLIKLGFKTVGLQTFLTAGPKEVRAWTIRTGDKAPSAAGKIHTDFEKSFIRAEVVSFADLSNAGSWKIAREKGLLRLEGKDYVMQDGDVVEFRVGS